MTSNSFRFGWVLDKVRFSVQHAEEVAAEVDTWLEEAYTQADMNYAAQQKYLVWDEALNQLWQDLKELLSEEEMKQLTNEELAWIQEKEQAALDAAEEYEGGSMYPAVYYGTSTPQMVSIYCGLEVSYSIFSRIFLICTVTVAISPIDSMSQIS